MSMSPTLCVVMCCNELRVSVCCHVSHVCIACLCAVMCLYCVFVLGACHCRVYSRVTVPFMTHQFAGRSFVRARVYSLVYP